MHRQLATVVLCMVVLGHPAPARSADTPPRPNVIFIFCDNLGYGDVGCFGSKLHRTPHIDRMAREGIKFTSFYATSGVCTPSRASLMTGCYPPLKDKWRNFRCDTEEAPARLHNLTADISETNNLVEEHPGIVDRLTKLAEKAREDLGDAGRPGKNQRPAAIVKDPKPRLLEAGQ